MYRPDRLRSPGHRHRTRRNPSAPTPFRRAWIELSWFTSPAKSIAIGTAPHRHRYAGARRWQFQIFAESWTKLSLLRPTEEESCGDAWDVLFRPMMRREI